MRGLLVNNEDLLRTNAQLNNEMKRLREQMIEIDRESQARAERIREMEVCERLNGPMNGRAGVWRSRRFNPLLCCAG